MKYIGKGELCLSVFLGKPTGYDGRHNGHPTFPVNVLTGIILKISDYSPLTLPLLRVTI